MAPESATVNGQAPAGVAAAAAGVEGLVVRGELRGFSSQVGRRKDGSGEFETWSIVVDCGTELMEVRCFNRETAVKLAGMPATFTARELPPGVRPPFLEIPVYVETYASRFGGPMYALKARRTP